MLASKLLKAELHQVYTSSFLIFADAAAKTDNRYLLMESHPVQKFHAERLPGKKVKLALLKQILVAATESLLQD